MERLFLILKEIESFGEYLVFYSGKLRKNINEKFFKNNPNLNKEAFIDVPNGEDPDLCMLEAARKFNSHIVTADNFREYKKEYPKTIKRKLSYLIINTNHQNVALIPRLRSVVLELKTK